MTLIKICGLTRLEDIEAVNAAKPDFIGFVFAPSRRRISPETAEHLRIALAKGIIPVGVFVNQPIEEILALVAAGVIECVQLHGGESEDYIEKLRGKIASKIPIIKAVPVIKAGDAQKWENSAADYLLLDRKGGGTGQSFDWDLIGTVRKPFFLAGGINAEILHSAMEKVRPFALDISSGAETDGVKDREKILSLVREAQK